MLQSSYIKPVKYKSSISAVCGNCSVVTVSIWSAVCAATAAAAVAYVKEACFPTIQFHGAGGSLADEDSKVTNALSTLAAFLALVST